jgi:BirA family biotin operon repressor/biotin-[acetyl-CoA-carboxylase] ligase
MRSEDESFNVDEVRAKLPGRRIDWHAVTGSTMVLAAELARESCASGTVVGADEQTAGIGRLGRSWDSKAGAGLYVSLVLRHSLAAESIPLVMLALGLAAKQALEALTALKPDLRWPNDVLIDGRKCAGILSHWEGSAIVAGIGINVNQSSFPEDLATPATSLRLCGERVRREDVLVELVQAVDASMDVLDRYPAEILRRFTAASSYASGRRVRVEQQGRTLEGVTRGLDASGFLILEEDSGARTAILAGGVRPA